MTDGIFEFIGSYEVMQLVHSLAALGVQPPVVAKMLVKEARKRWRAETGKTIVDDCTAVVVFLQTEEERRQQREQQGGGAAKVKACQGAGRVLQLLKACMQRGVACLGQQRQRWKQQTYKSG